MLNKDQDNHLDLISLAEAGKLSGYHQDYLGSLCRSGKLPGQKIGRNWVVSKSALEQFMGKVPEVLGVVVTGVPEHAVPVQIHAHSSPVRGPQDGIEIKLLELRHLISTRKVQSKFQSLERLVISLARKLEGNRIVSPVNVGHAKGVVVPLPRKVKFFKRPDWAAPQVAVVAAAVAAFAIFAAAEYGGHSATEQLSIVHVGNKNQIQVVPQGAVEGLGTENVEVPSQQPVTRVAGTQTVANFTETRTVAGTFNEQELERLILNNINSVLEAGWFGNANGGLGNNSATKVPAVPSAPTGGGQTYAPIFYYPPSPSNPASGGGSLFSATNISSDIFTTKNATVTENLTVNGTITGALSGTINPGFTAGSLIFQGAAALAQDATSLFWDDTNNAFGIGTNLPAATAALDITSTTKGFLAPRMTTVQRDAISSPATGLLVYNTTTDQFNVYAGGVWTTISGGGGGGGTLSDITAATGNASISNSANNVVWNWQLTGAETGFTFGENLASTGGGNNQYILKAGTLAASTAIPLYVENLGSSRSFQVDDASGDASPFIIDASGNVGVGGDLTVTGDDLFLTTNTDGYILVADGTNFNPVAVSGDITITNVGVTAIGTSKVTNTMLSGSIAASKLVGTDIATLGTITSGTWNGTVITDTYVSDTLTSSLFVGSGSTTNAIDLATAEVAGTLADGNISDAISISSSGSVHWDALNNYPAACAAGSAISTLADTTNTCTSFNTDTTITLQDAYDATSGNSITTSNNRDIDIVLANTATDSNLDIVIATDSTSTVSISRAAGSGTANPSQLILVEDLDADLIIADGISIRTAGVLTDAVDASDTEIVNALNIGSNNIVTGATTISSTELDRLDGKDANLVDVNDAVTTAITGVGTVGTGVWQGTAVGAQYGGTGLNTSASSGVPSINSGVWQANAIAQNGVVYGGASNALSFTAQGGANTVLIANAGAPSFSASITVGTSVTSPTINATTALQLAGTSINTGGTLSNVAYLDQANIFSADQTITKADPSIVLNVTTATDTDFWIGVQDDAGGDDDDKFQIGDGTTSGTNPFLTIDTSGKVGIGTTAPAGLLEVVGDTVVSSGKLFVNEIDDYGSGTVTLYASWLPAGDNTRNTGSAAARWATGYYGTAIGVGVTATPEALLEVQGIEGADAVIALDADDGDDTTDTWFLTALAAGSNAFSILNHTTELLNLSTGGNLQIDGDLTISGDDLVMATNTDAFILVADGTNYNPVAMSGDITITNTGATAIGNDKVVEADLKAVDAAGDEECLTYESTVGDFEWQTCGSTITADSLDFIDFEDTLDLDAALVLNQGTNTWTQNFTGDTTTALSYVANSLTTGKVISVASSSLTIGNLIDLQVSGTAAAASQTAFNILTTGANATSGITTYGAQIANTHSTNTSINVGLLLTASGGATANYALLTNGGNVGIGDTSPAALFTVGTNDVFQISATADTSWVLGASDNLVIDAAATDTTTTAGVIDLDVDSSTNGTSAVNINLEGTGSGIAMSQHGINMTIVPSNVTFSRSYNGMLVQASDSGSLANFVYGLNINVTTANTSDSTYPAIFTGGNVGIGIDTTPDYQLELATSSSSDPSFGLTDGDVSHGLTVLGDADAFLLLRPISSTAGGTKLESFSDTDATALNIYGYIGSTDPTDTVSAVKIVGAKKNTTDVQDLGAAETVFQVANNNDTAALTILGSGNVGIGLIAPASLLHIQQAADSTNTSTPVAFDINSVGAAGELTASSGTQTFARIAPVVNQTGSASYDALLINPTETSAPGTNYLFRGQVGGTDKFKLASGGEILMLGGVITNISGNGAYWYRPGVDIAIGNNGDSGASSISLQAGGGGSSGSKITFKVDDADQGAWSATGLAVGSTTTTTAKFLVAQTDAANLEAMYIDTEESTTTQNVFSIQSDTSNGSGADTLKFKITADGSTYNDPGTFTTPADVAEMYYTVNDVEPGDVVVAHSIANTPDGTTFGVRRFDPAVDTNAVGIISTKPGQTLGYNWKRPDILAMQKPVALAGRVPVKISLENGPVKVGDYLTTSVTKSGYAMKAIVAGQVIGQALEEFPIPNSQFLNPIQDNKIEVFMSLGYWTPIVASLLQDTEQEVLNNQDMSNLNLVDASVFGKLVVTDTLYVQKDLYVKGVVHALEIQTDKLTTKELCLEDVCVNKEQLRALLHILNHPTPAVPDADDAGISSAGEVSGDSAVSAEPAVPADGSSPETPISDSGAEVAQ